MKILMCSFFYQKLCLNAYFDHFCRWFANNLDKEKVVIKFLLYEKQYNENLSRNLFGDICIEPLTNSDIEYIFDEQLTHDEIYEKFHFQTLSKEIIERLEEVYKKKFGDWIPDIIIGQGSISTGKALKLVLPDLFCLTQENGIFSRPPFPRTLAYEPFNHVINAFPRRFRNDVLNVTISKSNNLKLNKFKKNLIKIIDKNNAIKKELKYYKKKFKKTILLPLSCGMADKLFKESIYGSGLEMVDYLMSKISKNIGVFVTQHDTTLSLEKDDITYLKNKYSNFIYLKETDITGHANNSLCYFKYVDAILNFTSKTGLMGLIYDKPVLSLVKTYNDWFKDGQGIEELKKVLNQPKKNKNNILYWYLTHYILFEKDFYKEDFLYNYIKNKFEKYKKDGITFDFYEKVNDIDDISEYTLDYVRKYYSSILKRERKKKKEIFLKKICNFFDRIKARIKIVLKFCYFYLKTF